MKILSHLWLVVIVSMEVGCSPQPEATIRFCESLSQNEQCQTDRNHFILGEQVYVNLEFGSSLEAEQVKGTIYRLDQDMKIPLSSKTFEIKPKDHFVSQNIPFHEFGYEAIGTFSIEFTGENDQLIAKREVTITRE
jgi:hypothetical protein